MFFARTDYNLLITDANIGVHIVMCMYGLSITCAYECLGMSG